MTGYLSILGVLVLAFILYMAVKPMIFSESFIAPAVTEIRSGPEFEKPRRVMPSGPIPPSQAAEEGVVVRHGEPRPADPCAGEEEAADAPENIRNVENSFRPAPQNDIVGLASQAGIAGETAQSSPQAYQKFGTDFVQNSGEFMTGIFANDTMSDANYSAF
jgi:hypothetical protein